MSYYEIAPLNKGAPDSLVVFLHGLGSDGQDLISLVPYFSEALPGVHFFSPDGIEKCDMAPFGYQWFSLRNRDPNILLEELEIKSMKILDLIEEKLNSLQLTFENLILIGFSQGTMLALYLTMAYEMNIKAVVGFSGAFLPPKIIKNNKTPICLIHGTEDEVVPYDNMKQAQERLIGAGVNDIETHGIKNLSHTIDLSGLDFAKNFLIKHLSK